MYKMNLRILIGGTIGIALGSHLLAANIDHARAQHETWSGYWWPLREGAMLGPLTKYDKIANAKVTAKWGIDYFQLVKEDGRWKIHHVLWQTHPPKSGE